jgi:hypothetical protein
MAMRIDPSATALAGVLALGVSGAQAFSIERSDGFGHKPPRPEVVEGAEGGLIKLRIVREKTGELAENLDWPEVLVLEAYFSADITAPDRPLNLDCWIYYRDPKGGATEMKGKFPCYAGRVYDGYGHWQKLNVDYRFVPERTDMNGTSGTALLFDPASETNEGIIATYGWRGGIDPDVQE